MLFVLSSRTTPQYVQPCEILASPKKLNQIQCCLLGAVPYVFDMIALVKVVVPLTTLVGLIPNTHTELSGISACGNVKLEKALGFSAGVPASNATTPKLPAVYLVTGIPLNSNANGMVCSDVYVVADEAPPFHKTDQPTFEAEGYGFSPSVFNPFGFCPSFKYGL